MSSAIISTQKVWLLGLVAHTRFLRKGRSALSPCKGDAHENAFLGAHVRWALANRLAMHESLRKDQSRFRLTHSHFVLDDCDAWTLNALLTKSSR
jgi:hypothetical protein